MATHLLGMLLGTEEDWPRALETLVDRLGTVTAPDGSRHDLRTERITIEPFDLRAKPRYDLVIDRLAYWYYVPREWLKKVALMDDVYLLNSPFTFQSMEKHSAYCALIRLGFKVPHTVLVPYKNPVDNVRWAYTAARYNRSFDLDDVAAQIGYPLFMKPFDGGGWRGVSRIRDTDELHEAYDSSGQMLMHLQESIEGYDVFCRALSIGPSRPADARAVRRGVRLPRRRARIRGRDGEPAGQRVLPLGVQLRRDARARRRPLPDRLRQRLSRRRRHQPALLLSLGHEGVAALVGVLPGDRAPVARGEHGHGPVRGRR